MARIRTVKPSLFLNEDLADLPMSARFLYIGLFTQADRRGRLEDRPKRLKIELLPYDSVDINDLLSKLQSAGFIIRYSASGGKNTENEFGEMKLIQIVNFEKHQRITGSEADTESEYPGPGMAQNEPSTQEGNTEETPRKQFGNTKDDRKGKEGKGMERNGKEEEIFYRKFAHLKISNEEFNNLLNLGFSKEKIDSILDDIENYKRNTKYKSLFLTAKKWLEKEKNSGKKENQPNQPKGNSLENILKTNQEAKQLLYEKYRNASDRSNDQLGA